MAEYEYELQDYVGTALNPANGARYEFGDKLEGLMYALGPESAVVAGKSKNPRAHLGVRNSPTASVTIPPDDETTFFKWMDSQGITVCNLSFVRSLEGKPAITDMVMNWKPLRGGERTASAGEPTLIELTGNALDIKYDVEDRLKPPAAAPAQ